MRGLPAAVKSQVRVQARIEPAARTRYDDGVSNDAFARKQQADLIIERTAQQLQLLLEEAAKSLRPFPPFPGAFFTNAIEVVLDGAERPDLGCIVVGEDGGLYELEVKIDFGDGTEFGGVDPVQARDEKLKKLDDLHPRDYIILAYNALSQITELLLEQDDAGRAGAERAEAGA